MKKILWFCALALGASVHASAQTGSFPTKEVVLTVNYGAGSNTDTVARILAQGMEKVLGQSIVTENRPGALGTMAVAYIARQTPDPYKLGIITHAPLTISPHLMDVSYTIDDFDFVCGFGRYLFGVAVRTDSPYRTIHDLVAQSKAGQGVFFGGTSTPNIIALLELGRATGGKFEQINYKSGPEAVSALIGGQIEAVVQNPSDIVPHVQSGRLRLLASASPIRWPQLADVPTLQEAGYPVAVDSWIGMGVRAGAPAQAVRTLEHACLTAVAEKELAARLASAGLVPEGLNGAQYRAGIAQNQKIMGDAIKAANIPRMTN